MKNIIKLFILGVLLQNCSETRKESVSRPTEKQWYEGGTLHKQKIRDWKNATEENKLATCGDFAAAVDNSVTMDVLLVRATELRACINEATRGIDNVDNSNVTEMAALCMVTLGYKKN
jgi:hypothetical protein